ncbi:hypothetical protein K430107D3_16310 [Dysosmobacter welbionis]
MLPKKDQLPFVTAICTYVFEGESKPLTGQASASFLLVKPILDKASKKAANGKRGGSKPKANRKQTESNIEGEIEVEGEVEREEENENDSYTPPTPSSRGKRFSPPTVDEVRAYCQERNNGVDPESFVAFYASKGWKIGQSPMKDWKQAVITWEKRRKQEGKEKPTAQSMNDETWKYIREMYHHKEEP